MAIGDFDDIIYRFNQYLVDWFGTSPHLVDSIIEGYAKIWSQFYELYVYVKKQTRIKTATDINLDNISKDFFGGELPRKGAENDESFRKRILAFLLREKATREGMRKVLKFITGNEPLIIEPFRPLDVGAYNQPQTLAYNKKGWYSSMHKAYQAYIIVYRTPTDGLGNYAGYNVPNHGYSVVQLPTVLNPVLNAYGSLKQIEGFITNAEIYRIISQTRMNSTRIWVRIESKEVIYNG